MTITDLDLTVLQDLEFEPPCEVKNQGPVQDCPNGAEWTIVYRNHCSPGNGDSMICNDHRIYLMVANGMVTCGSCKSVVRFLPYLVRIERIKP